MKIENLCHELCNSMVSPLKKTFWIHATSQRKSNSNIYCKLDLAGHPNGFSIIRNSFQVPGLYKSTATIDDLVPISATV